MTKVGFQDQLLLNAGQKYYRMPQGVHSAILSTFINLPFAIKTIFCLFMSGHLRQVSVVSENHILAASSCTHRRICYTKVCHCQIFVSALSAVYYLRYPILQTIYTKIL